MKAKRGMGENIAVWWPGETTKVWQGLPQGRAIRPRMDDIEYLRGEMPRRSGVIGEITSWQTTLTWGRTTVTGRVTGTNCGVRRDAPPLSRRAGGRFFNPRDEAEKTTGDLPRGRARRGDLRRRRAGGRDPAGQPARPTWSSGSCSTSCRWATYKGPDEDHAIIPITTFAAQFGRQRLNNIVFKVDRPEAHARWPSNSSTKRWPPSTASTPRTRRSPASGTRREGAKMMGNMMLGISDLPRHHRRPDPAHRRHRRGQHHVRRGQGEDPGDRRPDGARRAPRAGSPGRSSSRAWSTPCSAGSSAWSSPWSSSSSRSRARSRATRPWSSSESRPCRGRSPPPRPASSALSGWSRGYFPARRAATVDPAETLRYE